ncbi:MAG: DUF2950 domain-containing protein [Pseudomonadota bacterium]|nr:DUF2950 domain-containing protein [Pseudomonadota bacterium]
MSTKSRIRRSVGLGALLALSLTLQACGSHDDGQQSFETPEAAFEALVAAIEKDDVPAMNRLLGPGIEGLLESGDAAEDRAGRARFVEAYRSGHALEDAGADRRVLALGAERWPFPIPAVLRDERWYLDGAEGADELVYRRIGNNELGAIAVLHGFVKAQQEYAVEGRDGDPAGIYALKLVSDTGLHNGLYWPTAEGEPPSPSGAFIADAAAEGHRGARAPYHGYLYRMLYRQGPGAGGGAREYFADGVLTQGFALLAWPATYEVSGVMTFMVNQDGTVFQKDLGEDTAKAAEAISAFDPDSGWVPAVNAAADSAPGTSAP